MDKVKLTGAAAIIIAALVGYYQWPEVSVLLRTLAIIAALGVAAGIAMTTEQGKKVWSFASGARNEVRKVIWPTRRETAQATLVVIIMVLVIGLYIWILDALSLWAVYDLLLNVRS
ncbi:MAG: protein translocase subunit SecE [marine bacterium B5-7]|nr:MAG: protein translocase subunit SecE [marine bacterium B5-7]